MAALVFEGVSKAFAGTVALEEVSLSIPRGQFTAVIGPSGCGKSTLLKLCNGLEKPDRGTVEVFGSPIDYQALPELRQQIGYAVQGTGLFPHLSVKTNITLLARVLGWSHSAIDTRVDELLKLTHLSPQLLDRYPHQLSGGQQQRVGLCRALMLRPQLLLFDEPFAAIDPITRRDIHRQILELQAAEPRTALLVTHDMREALELAERIVVMNAGAVVAVRDRESLLADAPGGDPEALLDDLMRVTGP